MAWLQADPSGNLHISFRFAGKKFKRSLRTRSRCEAESRKLRLEENIRLVETGRLEIDPSADIPTFLVSDGKLVRKQRIKTPTTLQELFEAFFSDLPDGNLEASTITCLEIVGQKSHGRFVDRPVRTASVP